MTTETLSRNYEITETDTMPTPLLDSIIPPSESVKVKSTRAMLLRLGETAAGVRISGVDEAEDPSTDPKVVEAHLKHSIGLFLEDVERSGYGIIYDQEGEVVSGNKLLDELAQATEEKARKARLEELNQQLAEERAQVASTEAEIARLMGVDTPLPAPVAATEVRPNVVDLAEVKRRRHFGAGVLKELVVGLLR